MKVMFCPTLHFRKESRDLPKAQGYWRYLSYLVKYGFLWKRREKEKEVSSK